MCSSSTEWRPANSAGHVLACLPLQLHLQLLSYPALCASLIKNLHFLQNVTLHRNSIIMSAWYYFSLLFFCLRKTFFTLKTLTQFIDMYLLMWLLISRPFPQAECELCFEGPTKFDLIIAVSLWHCACHMVGTQ